jgi:hypothetical protein
MERTLPVWAREKWWTDATQIVYVDCYTRDESHAGQTEYNDPRALHFTYVSEKNPGLIAYTADDSRSQWTQ